MIAKVPNDSSDGVNAIWDYFLVLNNWLATSGLQTKLIIAEKKTTLILQDFGNMQLK